MKLARAIIKPIAEYLYSVNTETSHTKKEIVNLVDIPFETEYIESTKEPVQMTLFDFIS
ncbi:hypothetical protein AAGG74_16015 [Bacillus mexicanus]|uniref:hypothetical protein n=1 Tax=Bacillus mexicanus TaxID=2834415 RepID=UPI003D235EC3